MSKWPKKLPELTDVQRQTRDEWMRYWHEVLPHKYQIIEVFNHGYPVRTNPFAQHKNTSEKIMTLEIGAGIGEHIRHEDLEYQHYETLELRPNMAEEIVRRFPKVKTTVGDIQQTTEYQSGYFDRIIAIHVLEHLPNLPAALDEISRIMKDDGCFQVVIPCEGGLAYGFARRISSVRMFNKKFGDRGMSYLWMMKKTEHVNNVWEIISELNKKFYIEKKEYFPLKVPFAWCNLCVGLNLKKRKDN